MKLMRITELLTWYTTGMHQLRKISSLIGNLIQSTEDTTKHDGQPGHLYIITACAKLSLHIIS